MAGPLAEQDSFIDPLLQKQLQRSFRKLLIALKDEQKAIEQQIHGLIQNNGRLKEPPGGPVFDWIVSVSGIGSTTATEIIVVTNEMTTITDPDAGPPKQMACHAGVAPFEYRSGTSIRDKTRVSHQAKKRLKALFHLGAMSCIRKEGELRTYYQRKVAEGKNKMLVLNAIRKKLIHRVYAVVRRREKYDTTHIPTLA